MAKVTLKNVGKIYKGEKGNDTTAVHDFTLEINDREFVVFVGPSDCGKSTILRMIAGLEKISNGEISMGGKVVNHAHPKDRDIAMVFQNDALYPHMSVYENMAFGLKMRHQPKAEIKKRVLEAAEILGIQSLLDRKPKTLSGAQRQRVAIGRAIVRQPKVFLFDEPLSNLDAKMRVQMRTEITKLHKRLQATMIYVTNDPSEAMTMGDRIVAMKEGLIQQIDSPLKLYNEPRNLFVAGFLGNPSMNFIRGKLKDDPSGVAFKEIGGVIECKIVDRPAAKSFVGKEVILGIRPESLRLAVSGEPPRGARFQTVVDVVEPMGAETNLYLETGQHTLTCRTNLQFSNEEAGHRMQFEFDPEKAHLFDPESTERIV